MEGAEEEEPEFDLRGALNNKRFVDFLGRYEDVQSGNFDPRIDIEKVKERYQGFESKEEIAGDLKKLYSSDYFQCARRSKLISYALAWKTDV